MAVVIYIESICDDDVGEVEGAFHDDGSLIHIWASNDAVWRNEYFDPILRSLGVEVKHDKFKDKLKECASRWL